MNLFTILGERCSGTNFLENAILENFDIGLTWTFGNKHFFGHHKYKNSDNVLFIGIVRNPYDWVNSFYRDKHHLPPELTANVESFLCNEFYSINEGKEIMEDRNIINNNRYSNIYESRFIKTKFLIEEMPKKVKNYILIKYEDLNNNYEKTHEIIEKQFNLKRKNKDFVKIEHYRGKKKLEKVKSILNNYKIDKKLFFDKMLDKTIEKKLGYL